jgi:hypothetical protein
VRAEGSAVHTAWLRRKDATKIKLPEAPEDEPAPLPPNHFAEVGGRMVAAGGPQSVRVIPPSKPPRLPTSVEILEGMGSRVLTHAHAIGEGASRDLLASRELLIQRGHVFIENFRSPEDGSLTAEGRAAYEKAKADNPVVRAAAARAAQAEKDAAEFANWVNAKEGTALAKECMVLMPVVLGEEEEDAEEALRRGEAERSAMASAVDSGAPHHHPSTRLVDAEPKKTGPVRAATADERALWHAVGYACRAINRALLEDWMAWSAALFTKAECFRAWAGYAPPPGEEGKLGAPSVPPVPGASTERAEAAAREAEAEAKLKANWGPGARLAALKMLDTLSKEHRRLATFRKSCANEVPPVLPMLRRVHHAEALPEFLHGAEGALARVAADLGVPDGCGLSFLGGEGLGAELVLQWWVGEPGVEGEGEGLEAAAVHMPGPAAAAAEGATPEPTAALVARLGDAAARAAAAAARQPPYVVVVESVGVSGGARARDGDWKRVIMDPPEPLPLLTSAPGSSYVPLTARAQGLARLPPAAGEEWPEAAYPPRRLRGALRLTGLLPNTCYAFRVRAYSRAGAGPYCFGAFTTAPAPPPAPVPALSYYVPRGILASEGAADIVASAFPFQPDSFTLCWDTAVDFRVGLLRLLRVFYTVAVSGGGGGTRRAASARPTSARAAQPTMDEDGIVDYGGEASDEEEGGGGGGAGGAPGGGVFDGTLLAPRAALLSAINCEVGLRNWLQYCVATPDAWVVREGEPGAGRRLCTVVAEAEAAAAGGASTTSSFRAVPPRYRVASTRPLSVLEALAADGRSALTWADVAGLFALDATGATPSQVLLAGLAPPPPPAPFDATLPVAAAEVLDATTSSATALLAITARSRPGSASSGAGAPRPASAARPGFNPVGGVFAEISQRTASLRTAQTKLTRTFLEKSGGGGGTPASVSRPASARPPSAARSGGFADRVRPGSATSAFSAGSLGATAVTAAAALGPGAPKHEASVALVRTGSPRDVSLRFSLLECLSDGPQGVEWAEIYGGVRCVRIVDKRLPGTAYTFKVQAINLDGQGSLFGPQAFVTTALPAPARLRVVGKAAATRVTIAWAPVSSANALSTAQALNKPAGEAADSPSKSKGADIDAILEALVKRSKGAGEEGKEREAPDSAAAEVPVRECDGGAGVSLQRVWGRYQVGGKRGVIPTAALRGLLCDLGAYCETAMLVLGAAEPNEGVITSCEGAAGVGAGEWRLAAARAALDPKGTGEVEFQNFSDWWNAVDAALAKAAAVNSVPGTPSRASSAIRSRPSTAGGGAAAATEDVAEAKALTAAVLYVVEARRSVSDEEVAAAAVTVAGVASRGGSGRGGALSRPQSARAALSASLAAALPTAGRDAGDVATEIAELSAGAFTPWTQVHVGAEPSFTLAGLLPNGHYQVRVTAVGRHAFSNPTRPLVVHLPPTRPFAPVVVRVAPRTAALRWYPGVGGADKFEVQAKICEALLPPGAALTMAGASTRRENDGTVFAGRNVAEAEERRAATGVAPHMRASSVHVNTAPKWEEDANLPPGSDVAKERAAAWATLYTGMSTCTTITGLLANTVYRLRVVAYSSAGAPSVPSHETQLVTMDNEAYAPHTPASARNDFVVECGSSASVSGGGEGKAPAGSPRSTASPRKPEAPAPAQDIVAGDTILWTEDVWIDGSRPVDPYHPAPPRMVSDAHPQRVLLCNRTIAATVIADSASKFTRGAGSSANVGGEHGPIPVGAMSTALKLVGKFPDQPRVMHAAGEGRAVASREEALAARELSLAVEWCTINLPQPEVGPKALRPAQGPAAYAAANPHLYTCTVGNIIKRKANDLAQYDTYRTMWEDEAGRWSSAEELAAGHAGESNGAPAAARADIGDRLGGVVEELGQ